MISAADLRKDAQFKAVQIGGPSGGCLTEKHLDEPLDFDSVKKFDAIVGSGGMVVMDQHTCMVEVARFFMSFTQRESCGKCVPCREGTKRMLEILEKIVEGRGEDGRSRPSGGACGNDPQHGTLRTRKECTASGHQYSVNHSETNIWNISTSINVPCKSLSGYA